MAQYVDPWVTPAATIPCTDHADIDLSALMPKLDSTASDLVAQQRDALLERKELAQKTKDFRKLEDSAKLTEYKTLLKCWLSRQRDEYSG